MTNQEQGTETRYFRFVLPEDSGETFEAFVAGLRRMGSSLPPEAREMLDQGDTAGLRELWSEVRRGE